MEQLDGIVHVDRENHVIAGYKDVRPDEFWVRGHLPSYPLLPGVLMRNARLKFVCRDVHLRVERSDTPFTRGYNAGQVIRVPVAHGEGNYEADEETLKRLEGDGRVLYRYCSPEGSVDEGANINGAARSIAGIVNERGNVLGMMPHPENHVEDIMGCTDGRGLFAGLAAHLDQAA